MNLGAAQRSLPMDPSSIYGQGIMQSKPGIVNTGKIHGLQLENRNLRQGCVQMFYKKSPN